MQSWEVLNVPDRRDGNIPFHAVQPYSYWAYGVSNGSTGFLNRGADLTGAADGMQFIFSCWFRVDGGAGTGRNLMFGPSNRTNVSVGTGNLLSLLWRSTAGGDLISWNSTVTISSGSGWHHVLASANLTSTQAWFYVDDVAVSTAGAVIVSTGGNIDFTPGNCIIFAPSTAGSSLVTWNGAAADLYYNIGTFLDLTVTSNRRKFIDAQGHPVNLGLTGNIPTGSSPILFLSQQPLSAWPTNKGSGLGMTLIGTLTETTSPSA